MEKDSVPFYSVIIPSFNREAYLQKALDSVLAQTFTDFEVIVIDDGSTDGTRELIGQYEDERVVSIVQKNRGVACARNRGLERARGEFVALLDSDDWWLQEKLERTREFIDRFSGIAIFHSEEVWYRQGELLRQKQKHKKPTGRVFGAALPLCCISISTAVVRRDVFDTVGVFDESFEACEDYDFWLRATFRYEVKLIEEVLTFKEGGRADQLSSSVWGLDRFRIRALEKMLKSGVLPDDDYRLAWDELRKKCVVFAQGAKKRGRAQDAGLYQDLAERYRP